MKRTILFVLTLCLCLAVFGTAFAETAATEAPKAETPATETSAEELYKTGLEAFSAEDYGKAMEYLAKAAELGNSDALFAIGCMYDAGLGVEQDTGKAIEYYQKAAGLGNAGAMNNLGVLYEDGQGVEQDYEQALKYYQQAMELGEAFAYASIGDMYRNGRGVEQDLLKAAEYFKKAQELGADSDEFRQGVDELTESLRDIAREASAAEDYGTAMTNLEIAAELGNIQAWRGIGWLYFNGPGRSEGDGVSAAGGRGGRSSLAVSGELWLSVRPGRGAEQ